jgi:hypothetical protein
MAHLVNLMNESRYYGILAKQVLIRVNLATW